MEVPRDEGPIYPPTGPATKDGAELPEEDYKTGWLHNVGAGSSVTMTMCFVRPDGSWSYGYKVSHTDPNTQAFRPISAGTGSSAGEPLTGDPGLKVEVTDSNVYLHWSFGSPGGMVATYRGSLTTVGDDGETTQVHQVLSVTES